MTELKAKELGYVLCNGQRVLCGRDAAGNPKYCFEPPPVQQSGCPSSCVCLTEAEAKKMGYQLCGGKRVLCGYTSTQIPKYCYEPILK